MDTLGLGVIGGGEAARKALGSVVSNRRFTLAAVACERTELADLVAPSFRTDVSRLMVRDDIQAVYVATPVFAHVDLALMALAHRKHVLIEKPLARTIAEGALLASGPPGLVTAVAFKKRFATAVRQAKRALLNVTTVRATYRWSIQRPRTAWRYSRTAGGGVLFDLGSHVFDLLEFLLGPIESVAANNWKSDTLGVEEACEIQLNFAWGHSAHVALDWSSGEYSQELTLGFEESEIRIVRPLQGDDVLWTGSTAVRCSRVEEYLGLFQSWADAIHGVVSDVPLLDAGLRNLAVLEACHLSAATEGARVKL